MILINLILIKKGVVSVLLSDDKSSSVTFYVTFLGVSGLLAIANTYGGFTNILVGKTDASSQAVLYGQYEINILMRKEDMCHLLRLFWTELYCILWLHAVVVYYCTKDKHFKEKIVLVFVLVL